jgi:hypothetical protein
MSRASALRAPARVDASMLAGAKPAPFPGSIEPCHPTLREEAPSGERWVHEIKFDGYRTQAHLRNGQSAVYARARFDCTLRFQTIADALAKLLANDLILDGEPWWRIRTASLISGCFTPISPRAARTGCSTTPSICYTGTIDHRPCSCSGSRSRYRRADGLSW